MTGVSASGQLITPTIGASDQVGALAIRVTRQGPYPASVTLPSGPFLLFISNRSGTLVDTYSLIAKPIPPAGGSAVAAAVSLLDLHSGLTSQRDHQLIQMLPGDYELHILSHPDWVVAITITANSN